MCGGDCMSKDIQDLGNDYIPRVVDKIIEKKLKTTGAVVIQGPKWCGKSSTAAHISASNIRFAFLLNFGLIFMIYLAYELSLLTI